MVTQSLEALCAKADKALENKQWQKAITFYTQIINHPQLDYSIITFSEDRIKYHRHIYFYIP